MLKKILSAFTAVLTLICLLICAAFLGNPVSKMLVTKNAGKYIQENNFDGNYVIESVKYDFKTSNYYVTVKVPDSEDRNFTLYAGLNGKIGYDTYESAVVNKWNTAGRINDQYRKTVENLFCSGDFAYNFDVAFGDIEFSDSDCTDDESVPSFAIKNDTLELDGEYDIYDMGKKAGCITLYVEDNQVSAEKLAEILLVFKKLADKEKTGFRTISCVLENPVSETDTGSANDRVEVMLFGYEDIYEDGLVQRVKHADEKARAYYRQWDEQKLTEEKL